MMSAMAAKVLAGIGVAAAGGAAVAQAGFAPGIAVALSHVPSWTHAQSVLQAIQAAFAAGHHPGNNGTGHP